MDTSAWFAYANRKDPQHIRVSEIFRTLPGRLLTSNYVVDETISLCRYRLGHHVARAVGSVLMDPDEVDLVRITIEDERAAWDLFCNRSDQDYSFTDCTSFTLMRRLGLNRALALDADFSAEAFVVTP
ncbi:MAG: PIN domain-containing protein [Halieaceae bacterium]|nr:PIN domain-containing protein [Halieaceae bacterium]